jgi:hypothetical protein
MELGSTPAQIYVALAFENADAYAPVKAIPVGEGVYKIISENPAPELDHWQFSTGDFVRCREVTFSGGVSGLVAFQKADAEPGNTLRIGFFKEFKGHDILLLSGNAAAIEKLCGICESLASGAMNHIHLDSLPFVKPYRVSTLAERLGKSSGLHHPSDSTRCFTWGLSAEDWEDVGLRVGALLEHGAGHQYPDDCLGVSDDVRLMVSMSEYSKEWWERYGERTD